MADTLELINTIPAELREQFEKDYVKIQLWQRKMLGWDEVNANLDKAHTAIAIKQRKALGWDKVHEALESAPWCDYNEQIVNMLFCYKCNRFKCPLITTSAAFAKGTGSGITFFISDYDDLFQENVSTAEQKNKISNNISFEFNIARDLMK